MLRALVGIKGGSGKSTIAVHLATYLHRQGKRVAVLDADPQNTSRRWLSQVCPEIPVEAVAEGRNVFDCARKLKDFEEIVCDAPAGMIGEIENVLKIADFAIIGSGPHLEDLFVASKTVEMAKKEAKRRRGAPLAIKIVLSRINHRSLVGREAIETAATICRVASAVLSQRAAFADSWNRLVWDQGYGARPAADEMTALCKELTKWPNARSRA